ncbi:energy transducer TonB [Jiulongibacter sediminis]|uniref:energy transducer TonB n=1 Tax=Jiulongibacter sediminis TaxID=1605367 RepID=UPI0026EBCD51|nr:energy transducer TonB [Jiulongibacter sediminis]
MRVRLLIILFFGFVSAFGQSEQSILGANREAEYSGGSVEMLKFIANNFVAPKEIIPANISGTLYVEFEISKSGKVEKVKSLKPLGFGIDEEIIRVFEIMPSWKPALKNGNPIRSTHRLKLYDLLWFD